MKQKDNMSYLKKLPDVKKARNSTTLWLSLVTFLPLVKVYGEALIDNLPDIVTQLLPVLSPEAAAAATATAGVLIALRRIYAKNPPIEGL